MKLRTLALIVFILGMGVLIAFALLGYHIIQQVLR